MDETGKFVISLDFELLWGVRDKKTPDSYGKNILGVWEALPKMTELFKQFDINATFATVGLLFASTRKEMLEYIPENKPNYINANLSPYNGHFDLVKENETLDRYHFASELIALLQSYPNHEISTHTFSHYYCLEPGQTKESFKADLLSAIAIANSKNITIKSIVFPRNQMNAEYLPILTELGIDSYRGNEKAWFYNGSKGKFGKLKRALRMADTYISISGHNCYDLNEIAQKRPFDIPSSRFLRPCSRRLKVIENLRLNRILQSMTYAAKNRKVYHLWWHPHNFGVNQDENFAFLKKILEHYRKLHFKYGFESVTMRELSNLLKERP